MKEMTDEEIKMAVEKAFEQTELYKDPKGTIERFLKRRELNAKIFAIQCAIEDGEINADEIIEKHGLAGRVQIK